MMGKFVRFLILFLAGLFILLGIYGLVDGYQKNANAIKEADSWLEYQAIETANQTNLLLNKIHQKFNEISPVLISEEYDLKGINRLPIDQTPEQYFLNLPQQDIEGHPIHDFAFLYDDYCANFHRAINPNSDGSIWKYDTGSSFHYGFCTTLPESLFTSSLELINHNNYKRGVQLFHITDTFFHSISSYGNLNNDEDGDENKKYSEIKTPKNLVIKGNELEVAIPLATVNSSNVNDENWVLGGKDIVIEAVKLFNFDERSDEITYFPVKGKFNARGRTESKLIYRIYSGYKYAIVSLPVVIYYEGNPVHFAVVATIELPKASSLLIPVSLLILGFILLFTQGFIGAVSTSKKSWITSNGIAKDLFWHEEKPAISIPFLVQASYLLTFKIEETDNAGNISKITPVEFILKQRKNLIENGEQVNVSGKMTKNNILSGRRLFNLSTSAEITAKGSGSKTKYYIALLIPLLTTMGGSILNWYFYVNSSRFQPWIIQIFTQPSDLNNLTLTGAIWNGAWFGLWIGLFIAAVLIIIMLIFDSMQD